MEAPHVFAMAASPHSYAAVGGLEPVKMICTPLFHHHCGGFFQFERKATVITRYKRRFRRGLKAQRVTFTGFY